MALASPNPTALDVICSSLRLINVLASGEVPDGAVANDSLFVLNQMIDSWNAERLMIYNIPRLIFSLVPGKQNYTVGDGGDFDIPRPSKIDGMGIISLNNPNQPLELPMEMMNLQEWQTLPVKNISSTLPLYVYDDAGFPFRTLSFWVIPTVAVQVAMYPWASLGAPATLTSRLAYPPGYAMAFRYNLALLLAAEFTGVPAQVLQTIAQIAVQSKAVVKAANIPTLYLQCDPAITGNGGYYDWRSDTIVGNH